MTYLVPRLRRLAAPILALVLTAPSLAAAQTSGPVGADLNVSPKRVVFDPNGRSATIFVFNQGDQPATYSVALVDRAMFPSGDIVAVDEALKDPAKATIAGAVKTADAMITYTPRRVVLQPHTSQVVRVRVLRPDDLAAGEYRSHLTVTAVPSEDSGVTAEQAAAGQQEGAISMRITALFSLSIPVIVRQGPVDVKAGLDGLKYEQREIKPAGGGPAKPTGVVSLDLVRVGANSVFGDVEIHGGPKNDVLGLIRGVAVYPEIDRRRVSVPLSNPPVPGSTLTVVFKDDDTQPGATLATGHLTVP